MQGASPAFSHFGYRNEPPPDRGREGALGASASRRDALPPPPPGPAPRAPPAGSGHVANLRGPGPASWSAAHAHARAPPAAPPPPAASSRAPPTVDASSAGGATARRLAQLADRAAAACEREVRLAQLTWKGHGLAAPPLARARLRQEERPRATPEAEGAHRSAALGVGVEPIPDVDGGSSGASAASWDGRFLQPSLAAWPARRAAAAKLGLPLGVLCAPLARCGGVPLPVASFGDGGAVRCGSCAAVLNPFCEWLDDRKAWRCNICGMRNATPKAYYVRLSGDAAEGGGRGGPPELSAPSYELRLGPEYLSRHPAPPATMLLLDCSGGAVASGALSAACEACRAAVGRLAELGQRGGACDVRVGLVCFDESGVTAFRLSAEKEQPQAVHMADLDAPFLPIGEGALAPVGAASAHIDQALELVPRLFRAAPRAHRDRDAAMRCAWRIALKLLAPLGGTLLHVLSSPASRPGAAAEAAAVDFYAGLAASCAAAGVRPVAIACGEAEELRPRTLMPLACAAAGRVHLLPGAPAAEVLWRGGREGAEGAPAALGGGRGGELRSLLRFYLHCGVSSEAGFDALLRVRCTRGLRVRCVCGAGAVASGDGGIGGAALPDYGALRAGDLSSEEEGEEGEEGEEEEEEGRGDGGAFLGAVAPPPRWWLPALGDPLRAEGLAAAPCARWRSGAGGRLCGPAEEPERLLARMESDAAAPKRLRLARWRDRIALFRLAACDGATALSVELEHADEALQCTHACLQIALLYTTPAGERRLRVHNARLSLANAAAVSAASAPDGCGAACAALMLRRCAREGLPALLLRGGAALGAVRERLAAALGAAIAGAGAAIFCPPREKASGIAPRRAPLPLPPCLSLLPHLAAVLARLPALQAPAGGAAAEEEALRLLCAMCGAGATRVLSALLPRVYAVLPAPGGEGGAAEAAEAAVGGGAPFPPLLAPCRQSLRAGGLYLVEDGDAITVFVGAECPAGAVRELFGADGAEELARRARGGAAVALRAPRGGEGLGGRLGAMVAALREEHAERDAPVEVVVQGAATPGERRLYGRLLADYGGAMAPPR